MTTHPNQGWFDEAVKYAISIFLLLLLAGTSVDAATNNATDCSLSAVQAAVNESANGDVVLVPAGTATWTNCVIVTNNLTLSGSGCTINGGNTNGGYGFIEWLPSQPSGLCRLTGFDFEGNTNAPSASVGFLIQGTCDMFRIDHCSFNYITATYPFDINGAICGVIDNNWGNFYGGADFFAIHNGSLGGNGLGNVSGNGDVSWASPDYYGQTNMALYIETNNFRYVGPYSAWAVLDTEYGSRVVLRYNNLTNLWPFAHGTTGRTRGVRLMEVYVNNMFCPSNYGGAICSIGSGTAVVWSNNCTGLSTAVNMVDFGGSRTDYTFGEWNGWNPWCSNNISLLPGGLITGTHTGTNNAFVLTDTNHSFTPNTYATNGYVLVNVTQGGTNWACIAYGGGVASHNYTNQLYGAIVANDTHTITVIQSQPSQSFPSLFTPMNFSNGDVYAVYQLVKTMDKPGNGPGDLLTDTYYGSWIPTNSTGGYWPHQPVDPVYQWGNINNGVPVGGCANGGWNVMQSGHDYFDNMPKPGYTPLVYPHPLASGTNPPPTYTLTYTAGTGGTISGVTPQTVTSGGSGSLVTATATVGYGFQSWSDSITTASRTDSNVTANISVTATFTNSPAQPTPVTVFWGNVKIVISGTNN